MLLGIMAGVICAILISLDLYVCKLQITVLSLDVTTFGDLQLCSCYETNLHIGNGLIDLTAVSDLQLCDCLETNLNNISVTYIYVFLTNLSNIDVLYSYSKSIKVFYSNTFQKSFKLYTKTSRSVLFSFNYFLYGPQLYPTVFLITLACAPSVQGQLIRLQISQRLFISFSETLHEVGGH